MKIILFVLVIIISSNLFAQEKNEDDYLQIGLYGGEYQSFNSPFKEPSYVINAVGLELENIKSNHFSFYIKANYQNSYNEIKKLLALSPFTFDYKNPTMYRFILNFGVKYYTRIKSPQIYFQLGLSHENLYVGKYSYKYQNSEGFDYEYSKDAYQVNELYIDSGVGLKFKLSDKINLDLQYGLGINFKKRYSIISSNTILAGIKYNL